MSHDMIKLQLSQQICRATKNILLRDTQLHVDRSDIMLWLSYI